MGTVAPFGALLCRSAPFIVPWNVVGSNTILAN